MLNWDSEQIFLDGDQYFDDLVKAIDESSHSITVEMYIFNNDYLGKKIANHLITAAHRGVKIQVIVDGVGSYTFFDKFHDLFQKNGVAIKVYNPLPFVHPFFGELKFWRKIQAFLMRFIRLNKRDHRKIITIDEKIMFCGSFNITVEHTRQHHENPWKDMGVRVSGENVKFAVLNFKKIWRLRDYYRYKKQIKKLNLTAWKQNPLRLNNNPLMKRFFYKDLLKRIQKAQGKVWLTTPYFIPKRKLIRTIGLAAKRGVDVRLLISLRTDVLMFRTLQYFYYPYLIKKGVKVFLYTDSVLHAKNVIIDDWTTIGSSNLNHRSILHDLEFDLVVEDRKNVEEIENNFVQLSRDSKQVLKTNLEKRPFWDKLLGRLFFTFKYWF